MVKSERGYYEKINFVSWYGQLGTGCRANFWCIADVSQFAYWHARVGGESEGINGNEVELAGNGGEVVGLGQ